MAQLFQEVLSSSFKACFKLVVFAIFNDHNSNQDHNPDGNVKPFEEVFKMKSIPLHQLTGEPLEDIPKQVSLEKFSSKEEDPIGEQEQLNIKVL